MADDRAVTYDLTTTRGEVRLNLTDTRGEIFSDDEIDKFLTRGGSVAAATVEGLKVLLVDVARRTRAFSRSEGGESMSYNDTAARAGIEAAIKQYQEAGATPLASVIMPAPLPMDEAWDELNP